MRFLPGHASGRVEIHQIVTDAAHNQVEESMQLLALAFIAAGALVFKRKRPRPRPQDCRLYRVDEIAVSTVLFLLGVCMFVLGFAG
jgi:hypothetical protein